MHTRLAVVRFPFLFLFLSLRVVPFGLVLGCGHHLPATLGVEVREESAPPDLTPAARAPSAAPAADMVVITADATVEVDDVTLFLRQARTQAGTLGGRVVNESLSGSGSHASAAMQLRLPPARVDAFFVWLTGAARIEARHLEATDVSRRFFDETLALENLRITARRLQALLDRGGSLQDVLQIERELERVRGELERLEGAHRFLADQAARATVELRVSGAQEVGTATGALFLVPAATVLGWVDPRGRGAARPGGALGLMFAPQISAELQLFPQRGPEQRSWLCTLAAGIYSERLGGGRRRWGNPHLGLVLGFGNVDDHTAGVFGGSAGVELFRSRNLLVDLQGRAQLLAYGKDDAIPNDIAVEGTLAVGVPF
jgi:hypothetical protein